jgi:hypothetical protein
MAPSRHLYQTQVPERNHDVRPPLHKVKVSKQQNVSIPTFDRTHISWIREGRISFEVFKRQGRKEDQLASSELSQGSAQSTQGDAKKVRQEEGNTNILRSGKPARKRKKPSSKNQEHIRKRNQTKEGEEETEKVGRRARKKKSD